jgi:ATP-binding cassette subfamily C protein
VALVGASGGGKSTLVQALMGLYPLRHGIIRYGGVEVANIGWDKVRDHVGVVLQHPVLFNASVRENLCMGRDYMDDDLWHALEVAQLKGFIANLEGGLDSIVGKNGVRLSGGQRQRLAVARVVLGQPHVVILDEATAHLDSENEDLVQLALKNALKGRTSIVIAHRLSTVMDADQILVIRDGAVAEKGRHEELITSGGIYSDLFSRQDLTTR